MKYRIAFACFLLTSLLFGQNTYHEIIEINQSSRWVRVNTVNSNITHLMIYQYGGADLNTTGGEIGYVNELNGTGFYDFNRIDRVAGDTLFLRFPITNTYDLDHSQLVGISSDKELVFQEDITVSKAFDGQTGGVIFLAANDRLVVNGKINADGAGFRGANGHEADSECGRFTVLSAETYPRNDWRGAPRAEGVGSINSNQAHGRAPAGNGGGGGNDHNTGGGGGGNVSEGGGGGINVVNGLFNRACRGVSPGRGGRGLLPANDRIYFGGGGGAGHANNTDQARGGNGGGLVVLWAPLIEFGPGAELLANGEKGADTNGDGAGGGGAGGSVLLLADTLRGNPRILLTGGTGGSVSNRPDRCFGPGGGGGGGRLLTGVTHRTDYNPTIALSAGGTGLRLGSNECSPTDRPAGNGTSGTSQNILIPVPFAGLSQSAEILCSDQQLLITDESTGAQQVNWELTPSSNELTVENVGRNLRINFAENASGTFRVTQTLVTDGRSYPGSVAEFTVYPAPAFDAAGIDSDRENITLSVSNPRNYAGIRYDFGDGTVVLTQDLEVSHRYASGGEYPVSITLLNENCEDPVIASQTITVGEFAVALTDVKDASGCAPLTINLLDTSEGTYAGRRWDFPGGTPETSSDSAPAVSYTEPGQYTATLTLLNAVGPDSVATVDVVVYESPEADFTFSVDTSTLTLDATGNATSYFWDFGDGTTSEEEDPTHVYQQTGTYTVVLSATLSPCTDRIEREIRIDVLSGLENLQRLGVKLFPNPTSGRLYLEGDASFLEVLDPRGRRIRINNHRELDLSSYPRGVYLVRVLAAGKVHTARIIRR